MAVEKVNTYQEDTGAPPGHDEAMAAKVDDVEAEIERQANQGDRPEEPQEKLAGKFDSPEELEKAYKELERKLGQQKQESEEGSDEQPSQDEAEEAVERAGLNMEEMSSYYEDNGELSEDHYEALEKAGIPRAYVDAYVEGIEAQAQMAQEQILSNVGGQEQYDEMVEWAKESLTEQEISRDGRVG